MPLSCERKVCDCYIAFSNLNNHPLHRIMGEGAFWRIPDKPLITTVFFDVDGTLTDSQGKVPESYANALRYMAQSVSLYLATSLSMEQAKKKLGKALFDLFRGGVFADGGLLSYSGQIRCLPVKVPARLSRHIDLQPEPRIFCVVPRWVKREARSTAQDVKPRPAR